MARQKTREKNEDSVARTRGLSTAATIGAVIGALALLGAGYAVGRMSAANGESQVDATAGGGSDNPAETTGRDDPVGNPDEAAHVHPHPEPADPVVLVAGSAPIEFDPPMLDFGFVPTDQEMRGVIRIVNKSDKPQKILTMRPDCKCTTIEDLSGETIPPHGSIELTAVMEARNTSGAKKSKIKFAFEGYADISAIDINSYVRREITADPPYIEPGEGILAGVNRLYAVDGTPFSITAVNGEAPVYADDFKPGVDEPRSEYTLRWDISGYHPQTCLDTRGRRMPKWWIIETDDHETPIVEMFVRHAPCSLPEPPRGRIWVLSKQRALLDEIIAEEPADFDVYLKWVTRDGKPTDSIREVRSESPQFSARLLSTERGADDRITCYVRITPSPGFRGLLYGNIRFYAYGEGHTQLLPVIARVVDSDQSTASR